MTLPATLDALEARAKADAESGWMEGNEQLALVRALRCAVDALDTARTDLSQLSDVLGLDGYFNRARDAIAAVKDIDAATAELPAILAGVRGA